MEDLHEKREKLEKRGDSPSSTKKSLSRMEKRRLGINQQKRETLKKRELRSPRNPKKGGDFQRGLDV